MKISTLILPFFIALLISCGDSQKYTPTCNPPPLPYCPVVEQPVRLALVLGGGGSKGLAHVGVLEELEAAHIPIDLIVGCSAGSIIGSLYCDYPNTSHLKETMLNLNTSLLVEINIWHARYGLCQGKSLRQFLKKNLSVTNFEDLKIPFFLVTTDLYSSELVTIGGGPIIPAVEASCSLPFIFVPVNLYGRAFVDGGMVDPVPVRIARHFDAEVVVAVDLRGLLPWTFPENLFEVAFRSAEITLLWQSEGCVKDADIIIRPNLDGFGTFSKDQSQNERIYLAGKEAAKEAVPHILQCLAEKAEQKREYERRKLFINQVDR